MSIAKPQVKTISTIRSGYISQLYKSHLVIVAIKEMLI